MRGRSRRATFGRSSTASRRTSWSAPTTSSRSSASGRGGRVIARASSTRLQPEQDRGQRLPGLVVQLARKPAAFELLRLDDAPQRVARDSLARGRRRPPRGPRKSRQAAGRRRRSERPRPSLSWIASTPIAPSRAISGTQRPVRAPNRRVHLLVDLGIVDHRVDALAAPPLEHRAALRLRAGEGCTEQLVPRRLPRRRRTSAASAAAAGRAIATIRASDQLAQAARRRDRAAGRGRSRRRVRC